MSSSTPIVGGPLPFEGRMFGGYRLARPIATGGMATVFLAQKTGPGRYAQTAAIKIIHPHLAKNRELAEMFMDEARLASWINHPSVCRVLDFGEAEGTYFLAMEYVRGESWGTVLEALSSQPEGKARVPALAAHVLAQACEGLHAIHESVGVDGRPLHIVHRDVAPQNLLVAYDGSVRLLDFGIASAEGRAHTGSTEVVRGRYAYMAPEQMRGHEVDRRADVWSLGVMLFEALSGQNPFIRETQIATMLAVTQEPLPAWPKQAPEGFRRIVERSLARAPEERFGSAREVGDALIQQLAAQGEAALSAELSRQMRKLFAEQISLKRKALRELSGDDGQQETGPSGYPAVKLSATPPKIAEHEVTERRQRRRTPRAALVAAGLGLFAASSVLSWYFTHPGGDVDVSTAQRGRATTTSAGASPGTAKATQPATAPKPNESAPTGAAAAPAVAVEAAVVTNEGSETRHHHSHHRHRTREEQQEDGESTATESEAKRTFGTVVVGTSQGWALVFEGSRKLGTTPLKVELPSGTHTLIIKPYGEGSSRRVSVEVNENETTKLRVDL